MSDDFSGPGKIDTIEWKSVYGKLLAIWPYGREEVQTKFGLKPAIRADVYDLDANEAVSMDALIFPRALVMQLSSIVKGKAVVGRLGQGESRSGQAPPWKLMDPTPEDLARAASYFAVNKPRIHYMMAQTQQQPVPQQPQQQQQPSGYQPAQPSYPPPPPASQAPPY